MRTQYLTHDILIVKLSLNFVCLCLTLSHVDNIAIGILICAESPVLPERLSPEHYTVLSGPSFNVVDVVHLM